MDDPVEQFCLITGANPEDAVSFLTVTDGDISGAVTLYFENPDLIRASMAANASTSNAPAAGQQTQGSGASNDPITIDDDADDDDDDDNSTIRRHQEEEDALIAQRMQDELYKQDASVQDGVRAPIASTMGTLVDDYGGGAYEEETEDQRRMREMAERRRREDEQQRFLRRGPAGRSRWDNNSRLANLFRPPFEIMCHLGWNDARDEGKAEKKWLLVNLQDSSIFQCEALNRDVWKHSGIVQLIKDNFIFLQFDKNDPRASEYIQFYFLNREHENSDNFPHVSIVDPRTGEKVKDWSGPNFPDADDFHDQLVAFLDRYSLAENYKNPVAKTKAPPPPKNVDAMTEEEMIEFAMQASLAGQLNGDSNGEPSSSGSGPGILDPDALTHSIGNIQDQPDQQSVFDRIPSNQPHVEPPANPAVTTRIQFRHATGRVIRRFGLDERVSRIFEWLKAEPLEGKNNIPFELKTAPEGKDLIEHLDQTIQETGLKNATVMIEYLED